MQTGGDLLLIDDDELLRAELRHLLAREPWSLREAGTLAAGRAALRTARPAVVLLDIQLPDGSGLDLLRELLREEEPPEVVILSGAATLQEAADSVKLGAADFLEKPFEPGRLLASVAQALRVARLRHDNRRLLAERRAAHELVGESPVMQKLREQIRQVAAADVRVMLLGESGTGKELAAAQIHFGSRRAAGPLVRVNCSALPGELVESELFGHERGAFTGAVKARPGRFAQANGGTLLLDEIGDMPLAAQPKLLRALESGEIEPIGAAAPAPVDVRVLSATHQDLAALAQRGAFREDLLYRLNTVPILLPPLRDRREDIPLLVERFLERLSAREPSVRRALAPGALDPLLRHAWPGNVRELRNVVERLFYTAPREEIERADVEAVLGLAAEDPREQDAPHALAAAVCGFERAYLRGELERCDGNVARLATRLGMDRGNLYRRLRRLGLLSS